MGRVCGRWLGKLLKNVFRELLGSVVGEVVGELFGEVFEEDVQGGCSKKVFEEVLLGRVLGGGCLGWVFREVCW